MAEKVLITGGEGFVGRAFQREFSRRGGYTRTIVDLKDGNDALDFFREVRGKYDLIIHLAAVVGGRRTIEGSPFTLAAHDLELDAAMLRWAVETEQTCPIVLFSSSAAYPIILQGRRYTHRLCESDILLTEIEHPDQSYGWVKLTLEMLAAEARKENGLDTRVFRPFSGYGADQDLSYPFPAFVQRAARRDSPFEVWGDGEQVRDLIHIEDVINGVLASLDAGYTEPLNLGTGVATSFNSLAEMVMDIAGYEAPIHHIEAAPVGVHYRVADTTNLSEIYTPKITLAEGVARALGTFR